MFKRCPLKITDQAKGPSWNNLAIVPRPLADARGSVSVSEPLEAGANRGLHASLAELFIGSRPFQAAVSHGGAALRITSRVWSSTASAFPVNARTAARM